KTLAVFGRAALRCIVQRCKQRPEFQCAAAVPNELQMVGYACVITLQALACGIKISAPYERMMRIACATQMEIENWRINCFEMTRKVSFYIQDTQLASWQKTDRSQVESSTKLSVTLDQKMVRTQAAEVHVRTQHPRGQLFKVSLDCQRFETTRASYLQETTVVDVCLILSCLFHDSLVTRVRITGLVSTAAAATGVLTLDVSAHDRVSAKVDVKR